ncbi:MAG: flagellum-specific ATP synthase FliI, partial [Xanthomonadaceae bacterium]|nr:flagellum-specific ATP synthase FliI [Xanthomonadaceae bacterium]
MTAADARTARAARWSEQLQRYAQRAELIQPPPVEGVLTRMIGLTLEAAGCQAAVGDRCDVLASDGGSVEAEVVGFSGDRLFLMPTGDIHGLKPNARVVPRIGAEMAIVGERLLGRIIDGAGVPLDGRGPLHC